MQLTSPVLNPKWLASRKYPFEMIYEFANAVMDIRKWVICWNIGS
jgi:hypothetical protein